MIRDVVSGVLLSHSQQGRLYMPKPTVLIFKSLYKREPQDIEEERGFWFTGCILQMAPECPPYLAVDWTQATGKSGGQPKKTWQSTFFDNLHAKGVSWSEGEIIAADRVCW